MRCVAERMTRVALENDYNLLSKDERLRLFLRARSRGNNQEAQVITDASPRLEQKIVDFSPDLRALTITTLIHCLAQTNLVTKIIDLWDDQKKDNCFLAARLLATQFVVSDKAWHLVCEEYGFDFDRLLVAWGDFIYVNYEPRFGWIKNLALSKTEYEVGSNRLTLIVPTVEEEIERYRQILADMRNS